MNLPTRLRTGFERLQTPSNWVCAHTPYNPRGVRSPPPGSNPGLSSYAPGHQTARRSGLASRARTLSQNPASIRSLNREPPISLLP